MAQDMVFFVLTKRKVFDTIVLQRFERKDKFVKK